MKSDWQVKKLSDIVEFNPTERLPKGAIAKKISMDMLQPFTKDVFQYELQPYNGGAKFRNGDTIMARITPCLENGKVSKVNILTKDEVGFGSTEYIVLRAIPNVSDPDFIYYLTISDLVRAPAIKSMVGSSGRQRVQQNVLETLALPIPPYDEQKKIAAIFSALDEKIAINRAINENLQQQARALYKSWFVDFEPFDKRMPDLWKIGKLKDVLCLRKEVLKAGERTDLCYLPIDTIPMNTFALTSTRPNEEAQSSLLAFYRDDIIIGAMRVYFHRVIIAPFDGITRSTCFVLTPKDPNYLAFGLLCCDQDKSIDFAQQSSKGSTMPYAVWDGGLGELEIAIPPQDIASEFNTIIMPMIREIQKSYYETGILSNIRDTLSPKLMSGEIDVSAILF